MEGYLRAAPPAAGPLTSKRRGKREGEEEGGIPNRAKANLELSQRRHGGGPGIQDRFLIDFRSQHEAKLGPSWGQVGAKLASESMLEGVLGHHGWGPGLQDRFLIDFGSQVGAKLEPSWHQNRIHTGMFFEAHLGLDFAASWARFWTDFGVQNGVQK